MRDFGGMVSFLALDEDMALDVVARARLFTLAESLMFGLLPLFKAGERLLKRFLKLLFHCLTHHMKLGVSNSDPTWTQRL